MGIVRLTGLPALWDDGKETREDLNNTCIYYEFIRKLAESNMYDTPYVAAVRPRHTSGFKETLPARTQGTRA